MAKRHKSTNESGKKPTKKPSKNTAKKKPARKVAKKSVRKGAKKSVRKGAKKAARKGAKKAARKATRMSGTVSSSANASAAVRSAATSGRPTAFRTVVGTTTLAKDVFDVASVGGEPAKVRTIVRSGIKSSKLDAVTRRFEISQAELAVLIGVNQRTVARARDGDGRLSTKGSDATARLVRVFDRAVDVLGDGASARTWLKSPNIALGSETPQDWLDTDAGATEVLRVLGRLEHGVFG